MSCRCCEREASRPSLLLGSYKGARPPPPHQRGYRRGALATSLSMPSKKQRAKRAKLRKQSTPTAFTRATERAALNAFLDKNQGLRELAKQECMQCGSWGTETVAGYSVAHLHQKQLRKIFDRLGDSWATRGGELSCASLGGSANTFDVCGKCMSGTY